MFTEIEKNETVAIVIEQLMGRKEVGCPFDIWKPCDASKSPCAKIFYGLKHNCPCRHYIDRGWSKEKAIDRFWKAMI